MLKNLRQFWESFVHKNKQPAYVVYFIAMPGKHEILIRGLDGISLKEVSGDTYIRHRGLKYWIQSMKGIGQYGTEAQQKLSQIAREDILNLIFDKTLRPFEGVYV